MRFALILLLCANSITACGQTKPKAKPNIFYISIGSCVYGKQQPGGANSNAIFPEKIDIKDLLEGFENDFKAYDTNPEVIRKRDSLDTILHSVTWDQPEIAHSFVQNTIVSDTLPGDMYINRCVDVHRIKKLIIRGTDTTEELEPPFLIDTLTQDIGSFFDSSDFRGAKKSAALISSLLDKRGATGITISSYDSPISRNMFFASIDSLWKLIQKSHTPNPMIVFYYCGHGYADGFGRRFLVPGTFTGALNKMPLDIRRLRSVFVKDLYDYLELAGYPFIILLDCCSDNQSNPPKDDINDYYLKMAINLDGPELTKMVYEQFFQPTGDATVIYSSRLGKNSLPVPDPIESSSYTFVGPLCRRILLAERKDKNLFHSFEKMQKAIMSNSLDKLTKIPGIYCKDCPSQLLLQE